MISGPKRHSPVPSCRGRFATLHGLRRWKGVGTTCITLVFPILTSLVSFVRVVRVTSDTGGLDEPNERKEGGRSVGEVVRSVGRCHSFPPVHIVLPVLSPYRPTPTLRPFHTPSVLRPSRVSHDRNVGRECDGSVGRTRGVTGTMSASGRVLRV